MHTCPDAAHQELRALYERLDAELAPFRRRCDATGRCCNFIATDHMLFVTKLEAAEMARAGAAPDAAQAAAGRCPYLRGTQCGIRERRALGCRIYYCDRTHEEDRNALYERFLKEIRAVETRHGIESYYGPVTKAFAATESHA